MAFQAQDGFQVVHQAQLSNMAMNAKINSVLEAHTYRHYNNEKYDEAWRNLPEVPNQAEIMPTTQFSRASELPPEKWNDYQHETPLDPNLPRNIIDGPWESKEAYIGAHYQILRKDVTLPLQRSVESFQRNPLMNDDRDTCIYTNITFKGLFFTRFGAASRIEFSMERSPKRVRWEQSKRLVQGTLVALSPVRDGFTKTCKVAVVAARPIEGGLDQNPPQIDLFWGDLDDIVFDPVEKYIMIEARSGYFEASRHMLVALQKLMTERFHLSNHLVNLDTDVRAPLYLEEHPYMDLSPLIDRGLEEEALKGQPRDEDLMCSVNVLDGFPVIPYTTLDYSQTRACQEILTKRIAIIQGPPGTGKTHVSVHALKALLASRDQQSIESPIVIACQTNHALDQMLNHVLKFETNVLRLGSRIDKANEEILKRTLYELRASNPGMHGSKNIGSVMARFKHQQRAHVNKVMATLLPLLTGKILTSDILLEYGIISEAQKDSLSAEGWSDGGESTVTDVPEWLGQDQLMQIPPTPPLNLDLDLEENEEDYENPQEFGLDDSELVESQEAKDNQGLPGEFVAFNRRLTGRSSTITTQKLRKLLGKKDLYDIPVAYRGEVYRSWEKQLNEKMLRELKLQLKDYQSECDRLKVSRDFANVKFAQSMRIKLIACTTTGLAKYRGLISAFEPKILMIEEAAETLEGTVIAGMLNSLEQLILVGDHFQLRANCNVTELAYEPHNLNISMFERLVNNSMGFVVLNQQRRMAPEIRQLLTIQYPLGKPFYPDLYDHPCVVNNGQVVGMGKYSTWFSHNNFPETKNADGSFFNQDEAELVAGFYNYLVLNGNEPAKITILTFYNGQRKTLIQELKKNPNLRQYAPFKVYTVDSYQGEENDIIILSLVRSNGRGSIGFLTNQNRVVVALSRARRGFYLFGSVTTLIFGERLSEEFAEFETLSAREPMWGPIIKQMGVQKRCDIDAGLPLYCSKHDKITTIYQPGDFIGNCGGCSEKCGGLLSCGHACPHSCHPFDHKDMVCAEPCSRLVALCGHICSGTCGASCYCDQCRPSNMIAMTDSGKMVTDAYGNNISFQSSDIREENFRSPSSSPSKFLTALNGYKSLQQSPTRTFQSVSTTNDWERFTKNPEIEDQTLREKAMMKKEVNAAEMIFDETYIEATLDKYGNRVVDVRNSALRPRSNLDDFPELEPPASHQANSKPKPFKHLQKATVPVLRILAPGEEKNKPRGTKAKELGTISIDPVNTSQNIKTAAATLINDAVPADLKSPSAHTHEIIHAMGGLELASVQQYAPGQQFIGYDGTLSGQLIDIPALLLNDRNSTLSARRVNLLDTCDEAITVSDLSRASDDLGELPRL